MEVCEKDDEGYFAEEDLSLCLGNGTEQELLAGWRSAQSKLMNVSGGLETGGGIAIDPSLLPDLTVADDEVLVLTAAHIVVGKEYRLVGGYDSEGQLGRLHQGRVVYADSGLDLALVVAKTGDASVRPASLNYYDLRKARPGEAVLTYAADEEERRLSVFSVQSNSSYGDVGGAAVRAAHPEVMVRDSAGVTLLSRPDSPGNSGSPLIASDGRILGLVSQRLPSRLSDSSEQSWTATVAIDADEIRRFLLAARNNLLPPR
ncbi:MAG TPA: serine protease [Candidatus Obscuribacter sp.]|nr:serine protease [Candidatus Obscuribacter sp.]